MCFIFYRIYSVKFVMSWSYFYDVEIGTNGCTHQPLHKTKLFTRPYPYRKWDNGSVIPQIFHHLIICISSIDVHLYTIISFICIPLFDLIYYDHFIWSYRFKLGLKVGSFWSPYLIHLSWPSTAFSLSIAWP